MAPPPPFPPTPLPSQPPSHTYSDPIAPPPPPPYIDPLAPSASPPFDINIDIDDIYNYQSAAGDDFFQLPGNSQFYAGTNSLSLQNNQPNDFLYPQSYQPDVANNANSQPYAAGKNIISHENHQSSSGNNFPIPHDNYGSEAGNSSLPHHPGGVGPNPNWNWRANLPVGMKFRPTDEELIIYYLKPHILHGATPPGGPVAVLDPTTSIYKYEPNQLMDMGEDHGDDKRYFITRVHKIGKSMTERILKTGTGFWKPTQAPKAIIATTLNGTKVGEKIHLAFYGGPDRRKTQWLMQELRLPKDKDAPSQHHVQFVLAVVYYYHR